MSPSKKNTLVDVLFNPISELTYANLFLATPMNKPNES